MNSEAVVPGRRLVDDAASAPKNSNFALFMDECSPDAPMAFPVSAGSGIGSIGIMDNKDVNLDLGLSDGDEGTISIDDLSIEFQTNFCQSDKKSNNHQETTESRNRNMKLQGDE